MRINGLITDEELAAARADIVECFAHTECLKSYTAEQLEAIALIFAAERLTVIDRFLRAQAKAV